MMLWNILSKRLGHKTSISVQSLSSLAVLRPSSTLAPRHGAAYGPEYESHEGFRHPFFIWTGVALAALAYYHNTPRAGAGQEEPWLTRFMTEHFSKDPAEVKETYIHNMSVVLGAAETAKRKALAERPLMRRMANAGNFDVASPYGLFAQSGTDFSDLRIKSYNDDLQKPEVPTPQHQGNEESA